MTLAISFGSQCIVGSGWMYHEPFELVVDPMVVPDPVVVGVILDDEELVGFMMIITVDTPEVTVERVDGTVVEAVADVAPLAQYEVYQLRSNCRSLSTVQNASHVPSGEMRSCARRPDWQKQAL
jgi:hypothetical protein